MTSVNVSLAVLAGLTVAALGLALVAFYQSRTAVRAAAHQAPPDTSVLDSALQSVRADIDGIAAQVHSLQEFATAPVAAASPLRNGLNLAKRSQALRLHRHGNPAAQIASMLQIPLQEVELLLKVHNIVISNLPN